MTYTPQADIEAMAEAIYKKMNSTGIGAAVVATPYHQLSKYSKRTFIMYSKAALAASTVHAELEKLQADVMCALRAITEYDTGLALAKAEIEVINDNVIKLRYERKCAEEELARVKAERDALLEALRWDSGSDDFADNGIASSGWERMCAPLIEQALQTRGGE